MTMARATKVSEEDSSEARETRASAEETNENVSRMDEQQEHPADLPPFATPAEWHAVRENG